MITGLNHVTFAVRDLDRSFRFYADTLGLRPVARWYKGAYFLAGTIWLALNVDPETRASALPEYTHLAFTIAPADLPAIEQRLHAANACIWQQNRSPGDSLYFLDPDGHKLELHTSDLPSRLEALKSHPPRDLILYP